MTPEDRKNKEAELNALVKELAQAQAHERETARKIRALIQKLNGRL